MKKLKISMGIWGINNLPDRFNVKGFGEDIPILDRIRIVGKSATTGNWDKTLLK